MKRTSEPQSGQHATPFSRDGAREHHEHDLSPGLYLVATPIGNARDITLRALDVLKSCDLIAAEDTRVTSKLFAIYGFARPLMPYNDHSATQQRAKLLDRLRAGGKIALVSDAGTPLVSDPGFKLVRAAIAEGIAVHGIPGPSAALAALMLSGLPTDRFLFVGFLPPKPGERRRELEALKNVPATLVFFESPRRLSESLSDMQSVFGDGRPAAILRELTKLYEEVRRGDLASLVQGCSGPPPKGEITIVVGGAMPDEPDFSKAEHLLNTVMLHMPLRDAAHLIAEALGLSRREVYARALALKSRHEGA